MNLSAGLAAAAGFGLADILVTSAGRRIGVLVAMVLVQASGLLFLSAIVVARGEPLPVDMAGWLLVAAAGTVNTLGTLLLYRAFAIGTLSVVSPIASGFAVVTALLALLAGERPPAVPLLGAGLLMAGAVLAARSRSAGGHSLAGVPEAAGAAMLLGSYFYLIARLAGDLGAWYPIIGARVVMLVLALAAAGIAVVRAPRMPGTLPGRPVTVAVLAGMADSAALVAFNLGAMTGYAVTTTALTSLYSLVTVLLARVIFHEHLSPPQFAGIAIVVGGAFLVSLE